jgi:hypothetical protein
MLVGTMLKNSRLMTRSAYIGISSMLFPADGGLGTLIFRLSLLHLVNFASKVANKNQGRVASGNFTGMEYADSLQTVYVILFYADTTKYPVCLSVLMEHKLIPRHDVMQSSKVKVKYKVIPGLN